MSQTQTTIRYKVNRKVDGFLSKTQKRKNLLVGSAGSGKSWGIAQHLLFEKAMVMPRTRFLITRTTGPALKKSCWLLMNDMVEAYDIDAKANNTDLKLTFFNGAQMFFVALDDVKKLKSMERVNYVWVEEATELTSTDYKQLGLRARGDNPYGPNQLYFSFNPDDENSFLKPICENPPDDTAVLHSTYKDNAFNTREYVQEIENLQEEDPVYWMIYGLGIWATPQGIIYSNWDIIKGKDWPANFDETIYGLDFGYTNPSVLLELGIKDQEIYIRELIYSSGYTNQDFILQTDKLGLDKKCSYYADSQEPDRIKEFELEGYNIYPSKKGKNSVAYGIDLVKRFRIHIHEDSPNLIKEKRAYKWKQDRNGNVVDGVPVKFNDHAMDAERYPIYTHFGDLVSSEVHAISTYKTFAQLGIQ